MNLGAKIREIRLQKQLTQRDVAGEYMTRNMLSKLENGSAVPSVKTLEHLARVLEVPMSYFVSEEDEDLAPAQECRRQMEQIDQLAELLQKEEPARTRVLATCIRARVLLGEQKAEEAYALMRQIDTRKLRSDSLMNIYKICEECCKGLGDFKQAYEYAAKRMELMNTVNQGGARKESSAKPGEDNAL